MYYAIVSQDVKDSLHFRKQARPQHIKRLEELKDQGRLFVAGPNPAVDAENPEEHGFTGSLIIAEFNNLQEAQAWADADPYVAAGVYASVSVKPFLKVLP